MDDEDESEASPGRRLLLALLVTNNGATNNQSNSNSNHSNNHNNHNVSTSVRLDGGLQFAAGLAAAMAATGSRDANHLLEGGQQQEEAIFLRQQETPAMGPHLTVPASGTALAMAASTTFDEQVQTGTWSLLLRALLHAGPSASELDVNWSKLMLALVLVVLMLTTAVGNLFVIVAILIERNLRTIGNYLVLSLAIADLLVALLVMPLASIYQILQHWTLGVLLCDIWTSTDVFCCTGELRGLDLHFRSALSMASILIRRHKQNENNQPRSCTCSRSPWTDTGPSLGSTTSGASGMRGASSS